MIPRTHTFSPSEFLIACGNDLPGARKGSQRAREDALELQHAAFVEDDGVEIIGLEACVIQAPFDGCQRKARVVLAARQPLFLNGADGHAVDHERGRRVVVVGRDPEDLHLSTGSLENGGRCDRLASSRAAHAARRVWPTMRTAGAG